MNQDELKKARLFSAEIKKEICKMIANIPAGHLGGALSVSDMVSVLYNGYLRYDPKNPNWDGRDWVIMSKGHGGTALYAALAMKGFFPMSQLETLNKPHTDLPSHCDRNHTPGIDMTTGSLGQGASLAAGVATGLKIDKKDNRVVAILGDGECDEGQVWEMALYASTKHLDNLIVIIDHNKLQIDGSTTDDSICNLGDLCAKFSSFGWRTIRIDGHDFESINDGLSKAWNNLGLGKPFCIVMDTFKGHGWSKSEGLVGSHSRGFTREELEDAISEINMRYGVQEDR